MIDPPFSVSGEVTASSPERIEMQYDWDSTDVSIAIVEITSVALNKPRLDLPTLCSTIDPDALNELFTGQTESKGDADLQVTFSYMDLRITICHDGELVAEPLDV